MIVSTAPTWHHLGDPTVCFSTRLCHPAAVRFPEGVTHGGSPHPVIGHNETLGQVNIFYPVQLSFDPARTFISIQINVSIDRGTAEYKVRSKVGEGWVRGGEA